MVFSSPPLYLDPHNWQHHHQQQAQILHHHHQNQQLNTIFNHHVDTNGVGSGVEIPVFIPPPVLPSQAIDGRNTNSIKPGSMSDRARQAKIPLPDPGLKCPRCQSTNTKFCYFNNYSLTQPRHFCKICRRYWTKGGALRNVSVGGGFRKNSKRSSNKGGRGRVSEANPNPNSTSPISSNNHNINDHCNMLLDNSTTTSLTGRSFQPPRMSQFPILTSLQCLNQHGCSMYNNIGFKFGAEAELGFQIGSSVSSVNADHQWIRSTPNHFPNNFLAGFDPAQFSLRPSSSSSSLYNFPIGHQCLNQQAGSNQHIVRPSFASLKNLTDQKDNNVRSCGES